MESRSEEMGRECSRIGRKAMSSSVIALKLVHPKSRRD